MHRNTTVDLGRYLLQSDRPQKETLLPPPWAQLCSSWMMDGNTHCSCSSHPASGVCYTTTNGSAAQGPEETNGGAGVHLGPLLLWSTALWSAVTASHSQNHEMLQSTSSTDAVKCGSVWAIGFLDLLFKVNCSVCAQTMLQKQPFRWNTINKLTGMKSLHLVIWKLPRTWN